SSRPSWCSFRRILWQEPTSLSATVAGSITRLRPTPNYTTLRDVTLAPRCGRHGEQETRGMPTLAQSAEGPTARRAAAANSSKEGPEPGESRFRRALLAQPVQDALAAERAGEDAKDSKG